jgi:hypothetical protein
MQGKCWLKIEKCNGCNLRPPSKIVCKVPKDEGITPKRGFDAIQPASTALDGIEVAHMIRNANCKPVANRHVSNSLHNCVQRWLILRPLQKFAIEPTARNSRHRLCPMGLHAFHDVNLVSPVAVVMSAMVMPLT